MQRILLKPGWCVCGEGGGGGVDRAAYHTANRPFLNSKTPQVANLSRNEFYVHEWELGARVSPPTNVFLILASALDSLGPGSTSGKKGKKYVDWICCLFSPLLREVFLRSSTQFSPLLKKPIQRLRPSRAGLKQSLVPTWKWRPIELASNLVPKPGMMEEEKGLVNQQPMV